jgi:transposase
MIERQEPNHDLGGNYFDNCRPEVTARRLLKRLQQLGFQVEVHSICSSPT